MTVNIPALERLLAKATPRPWEWVGKTLDGADYSTVIEVRDLPEHACIEMQSGELIISESDAALIAALVNAAPALLAVVKAAVRVDDYAQLEDDAHVWDALPELHDALAALDFEEEA